MVPGSAGRMLKVDLSTGKIDIEDTPEDLFKLYLGGYALAEALCSRWQPAGADPLGEENVLCFSAGLLSGHGVPFSGRFMVSAKSPATGGVGESNGGGHFGPALKRSGFDLIAVRGRSERPVTLEVNDGRAEIKDASALWGMDTVQTDDAIRSDPGLKGAQLACIGPAGENLSLMAGIVNDRARIAARMGLGAVMGSKKLKAVVVTGKRILDVHDKDALHRLNKEFIARYKRGAFLDRLLLGRIAGPLGVFAGVALGRLGLAIRQEYPLMRTLMKVYGTAGFSAFSMQSGDGPVQNWKGNPWESFSLKRSKRITDSAILQLQEKRYHCLACPLGCGGELKPPPGFSALPGCHKPEYESLASLGALLLVDDLDSLLAINDFANRMGLDTISLGGTLAFAAECVEKGTLSREECDGLDVRWGHGPAFLDLSKKIAKREGVGDLLADGVKRASRKIGRGSEAWAIHAGGIELPMHDPRNDPGYGVVYSCDAAPGKHSSSVTFSELMQVDRVWSGVKGRGPIYSKRSRFDPAWVGQRTGYGNLLFHLTSCAGLCVFGALTSGASWPLFDWINACTGWDLSKEEFKSMALRIVNLRWAINLREGVGIKDFGLPDRVKGKPPLDRGPNRGHQMDDVAYAKSYFDVMGWDYETGTPSPERMKEIGMPENAV